MVLGIILKVYMIVLGVLCLISTMRQLAKRTLLEDLAILWFFFGVFLIVLGAIINISNILNLLGITTFVLILLFFAIFVWTFFGMSLRYSSLQRKNHELSMQVTLLNQENERIIYEVAELEERNREDRP